MRQVKILRKDGGYDEITAYLPLEFPWQNIDKKKQLVRRKKGVKSYCYEFGAFDIETTTIEGENPYGFMYHWQMCVGGIPVYGRTWEDFGFFIMDISNHMNIDENNHFVIYVHNLAFEYQFCRLFLKEYAGGYDIFAPQERKPLTIKCKNGIEFRCSFKLTNMSLSKFTTSEMGVTHIKASGDLDYKIIRTPKTELNDTEFGYCISDVISLYEGIKAKLHNGKDNLESIPLTSTGYVRRDTRKSCLANPKYRETVFLKTRMTELVFTLLSEAGRGGNVHSNRYLTGRILHWLDSYDVQSSYPAMIMLMLFPMTKFVPYGKVESIKELDYLISKYACLFRITLTKVKVKGFCTMPYIPISKCTQFSKDYTIDNGRILNADFISITVTDIDWRIIKNQYDFEDIYITDMHIAKYGPLPEEIKKVVMQYFGAKCKLKYDKEIETDPEREEEIEYFYGKSKNSLNSIFGMMYTNPLNSEAIELDDGTWTTAEVDITEGLNKFYKSRNSFLYYAWGVWITAHARYHLQTLIDTIDSSDNGLGYAAIYSDTDSCKGIGIDHAKIEALNDKIKKKCEEKGAYYDYMGTRYYLGIYEHENKEPIKSFITLGAKKYAYEDEKGLHLTVSGVQKKKGAEELKNIENFKTGFVFNEAGGQTLYYNDDNAIHRIKIGNEWITTGSNIGMIDSTYTLGITNEYADLIGYMFDD